MVRKRLPSKRRQRHGRYSERRRSRPNEDDEDHDEDRHDYVGDVDHVRATTDAHETTVIETMAEGSPRRIGRTDDEERGQWRSWFR